MNASSRPLLLILALACLVTGVAQATQIIPFTTRELGNEATLVVRGHVSGTRSFWNDTRSKIFTEIEITVDESFKGAAPTSVTVLQLGGVVDDLRLTVSGALHWKQSEEVLLFLQPYTTGTYQVTGFSQGKFEIERDPATDAMSVSRPELDGVEFAKSFSSSSEALQSRVRSVSLDQFLEEALGQR